MTTKNLSFQQPGFERGAYFSRPFILRPGARESSRIRPFENGYDVYVEGPGRDGLRTK